METQNFHHIDGTLCVNFATVLRCLPEKTKKMIYCFPRIAVRYQPDYSIYFQKT